MIERAVHGFSKYRAREDGEIISYWGSLPRPLVGSKDKDGYVKMIIIRDDGNRACVRRCSFICEAFHGPRPAGMGVRHLDGSKDNDRPSNLSWATHKQNCSDKIKHGTSIRGERNPKASIDANTARVIKEMLLDGESWMSVQKRTGASRATIDGIKYGKTWNWLSVA